MAQIDQFIGMMVARKFERAVLVNDQPGHLWSQGVEQPGPIIARDKMQTIIQEATPPPLRSQLAQDGTLHFAHSSPHGIYNIEIERSNGHLQISLAPAFAGDDAAANGTAAAPANATRPPATNGHATQNDDAYVLDASALADIASINTPMPAVVAATPRAQGTRRIEHIDELFRMMKQIDASDLHLSSGETPMMRVQGIMKKLEEYKVNDARELEQLLFAIAPERNREQWQDEHDTDFAYEIPGLARFRCNFFADRHGIGGVFRLIPSEVLTVEQLGLPKVMTDLCSLSKGLVVVTGPTGSGKSTTLAALIDYINKHREDHIITIEDPVEFVHHNIKCLINQREVHVHTDGF